MWFVFKRLDEKEDRHVMKRTDDVVYSHKSASSRKSERKSEREEQPAVDIEQFPISSTVEKA